MTTQPGLPQQLRTVYWSGGVDGCIELIDQTLLPAEEKFITCHTVEQVWEAIKVLRVRGAPAIGVAAAMGVVVGVQEAADDTWLQRVNEVCSYLATSRPTAVNLFWALDRMKAHAQSLGSVSVADARQSLLDEAQRIRDEDAAMCHAIGRHGAPLIRDGMGVLTHCNAGGLATSEYGTALAVLYEAHAQGKRFSVYADETRPLLQGARLTAWELQRAGLEVTVLCDNAAAWAMASGKIDLVITGADRIAANGDVANKIGTYGLAVLAGHHGIPMYVAAPESTLDKSTASGLDIPIEQRSAEEVAAVGSTRIMPPNVGAWNPAFDVTPASFLAGIITDKGVITDFAGLEM